MTGGGRTSLRGLVDLLSNSIKKHGVDNSQYMKFRLLPQVANHISLLPLNALGAHHPTNFEQYRSTEKNKSSPVVRSLIYKHEEQPSFRINIIRMFAGTFMPLHGHDNMYTVHYLLDGKLQHANYDFLANLDSQDREEFRYAWQCRYQEAFGDVFSPHLQKQFEVEFGSNKDENPSMTHGDLTMVAKRVQSTIVREGNVIETFPDEGDLHEYQAISDCSLLQVRCPDYFLDGDASPVTYYKTLDTIFDVNKNIWLPYYCYLVPEKGIPNGLERISVPFDGEL